MPILNVTLSTRPDAAQSASLAAELTELTRAHLRKDPTLTAVAIQHIDPTHWFAGGPSLAAQGRNSFWLDIKVVDGTNTKTEIAGYLEAVTAAMARRLAPLHHESYTLVHEVAASAYGFGGRSQEHRFVVATLPTRS